MTRPAARRRAMLPAAVIAVVLLGGGLALALASRSPSPGGTAAPPGPAAAGPGGPAQPQQTRMDLAGVRWSDFHGAALPVSAQAGPRHASGGTASGFAHTALGAVLAAVNIGVRANAQWGPRIFAPVIRDQVTGPDAARLLASCQAAYQQAAQSAGVTDGQPLGAVDVTEQAFRWITYTPAAAIFDLVSAGPGSNGTTAHASVQMEVVWDDGDWKLVAPPGGDWGNSAAELSSLAGYTVFPGRG